MTRSVLPETPLTPPWEREDANALGTPVATSLLMCAPTAYALKYEINPWMKMENAPDIALASQQWQELYRVLTEEVGANVLLVEQAPECPDMVFTANAGLVRGRYVLLSNFRHPQRQI